ncbi:MAG: hypothetical protein CVT63_05140 [Candidatus Anoxymicrobium japonicum]|uniref:Uncharacterized protein n=1 Tax=Candidatus Anoxymicrobium japonicum TaxID=2013648 RepID=A0A2N3G5J3_9ACTN|nr:MAG: hypothetical protein CVT63_05140 [Candidatus Anoxymicrobium japonicum]
MLDDTLYKKDAERLAAQIVDENPMVDILDIRMDSILGGYVIIAYDYGADEEFTVDRIETWNAKRSNLLEHHLSRAIGGKVHTKKGRKVGSVFGHWIQVSEENWSEEICDAVESRRTPGEALLDLEPSLGEAEIIYPGEGRPGDYGFDGNCLVMINPDGAKVFKQIVKLANFTLTDQSNKVIEWRTLGFDISPRPEAPMIELGTKEWGEDDIVDEIKDRLLDLSNKSYGAILVDGQANATAYAWVLAGIIGLKVIMAWNQKSKSTLSRIGYTELLHYKEVEESL